MNGLYVKAKELDRGHNEHGAPSALPPGASADAVSHASTHPSDDETHASDAETHASDAETHPSDAETHASDVESHASDR